MGIEVQPKFISFDMNGTLIHYRQDETVRKVLGDRLPAALADDFELAGEQIRFDECMGEWRSMHEVIEAALRRTMARFGLDYREGDARAVYDQIPTWTPYPGVPEALRRLAEAYPLVILTNTDDVHAPSLVENLQAPFDVVITAEQARAYKPRLRAFDHMVETLGVDPTSSCTSHRARRPVRPPASVRRRDQEQGLPRPRLGARPAVAQLHPDQRHRRAAGALRLGASMTVPAFTVVRALRAQSRTRPDH